MTNLTTTSLPQKVRRADDPVMHPRADLLGTSSYAEQLANQVLQRPWPLTIGVYGEWGEGKTSFVKLVHHYLEAKLGKEQVLFISFSAWPYTTSSAIWRALGRKLAKRIYGFDQDETRPSLGPPPEEGWLPNLRELFRSNAFTLSKPGIDPRRQQFEAVIRSLDTSAPIVTGRSSDAATNQTLLGALTQIITQVATPLAPWLSKLSGLKVPQLKSSAPRTALPAVESVEQTKELLSIMFERGRKGNNRDRRVVLFIDDLDRCLPEVALEVLEALKIFLDAVPGLFIVAADHDLIGRGLWARYRLPKPDSSEGEKWNLDQGRQYLEKILQFGVKVPSRSATRIHGFIASQFPEWASCTDLLEVMAGTNPRRLIQSCTILSYEFAVAMDRPQVSSIQVEALAPEHLSALEKLIKCSALDTHFLEYFRRDLALQEKPQEWLTKIESKAEEAPAIPDKEEPADELTVVQLIRNSELLASTMRGDSSLANAGAFIVSQLANLADLQSARYNGLWNCSDRMLLRLLEDVASPGGADTPQTTLTIDLARVIEIHDEYPRALELLGNHANQGVRHWASRLSDVEDWLTTNDNGKLGKFKPENREAWLDFHQSLADPQGLTAAFLGRPPRLSTIHPLTVTVFLAAKDKITEGTANGLTISFSTNVPNKQASSRLKAQEFISSLASTAAYKNLSSSIELRLQVASYYWEHRKFAKLEALMKGWPGLANRILLEGTAELHQLEELFSRPRSEDEWDSRWKPLLSDERLHKLMRLRPYFADIAPAERDEFLLSTEAFPIVSPNETQEDHELGWSPETPNSNIAFLSTAKTLPQEFLQNTRSPQEIKISLEVETDSQNQHLLTLDLGGVNPSPRTFTIEIPLEEIRQKGKDLRTNLTDLFFKSSNYQEQRLGPLQFNERMRKIRDLGVSLFETMFQNPEARKIFLEYIQELRNSNTPIRLAIQADNVWASLPWEIMFFPEPHNLFVTLSRDLSLIRRSPKPSPSPTGLSFPIRILLVHSNPSNLPELDATKETRALERVLAPAVANGYVELQILGQADVVRLNRVVAGFRPHIFHYIGHGHILPDSNGGALIFQKEDGQADVLGVFELSTLLAKSSIQVAVLNGCDTGMAFSEDEANSVADTLVDQGIPAVIATIHPVLDRTAISFAQEFYKALLDGLSLERALTESRRVLHLRKDDWTAYAIFSNASEFETTRLFDRLYRDAID